MRAIALGALMLAGCQAEAGPPPGDVIACGPAGGTLGEECTVERRKGELVLHQPDGGFRRLTIGPEGLTTADGAEEVAVRAVSGGDEVTIGGWTYRLPPTP